MPGQHTPSIFRSVFIAKLDIKKQQGCGVKKVITKLVVNVGLSCKHPHQKFWLVASKILPRFPLRHSFDACSLVGRSIRVNRKKAPP